MQAVILAGGMGSRLHPVTTSQPKSMVGLFDVPVMEHNIRLLKQHGIDDIIITVSYLAQDIINYFGNGSRFDVRIRYSVEGEPLGSAGGVKRVQNMLEDTFVVMCGDSVTDADFTSAIKSHNNSQAIATLIVSDVEDPTEYGVVERDGEGCVIKVLEKPDSKDITTNTVCTGMYIFEPEALSCIPYFQKYEFSRHLFPSMLANQEKVHATEIDGYWCDIDTMFKYRKVHFDALAGKIGLDLGASHMGGGVWMGKGAEVDSSAELCPPCYIGAGAVVKAGAYIAERTVIGAESIVEEKSYISRSILGKGAFVGTSARVTDSIVGAQTVVANEERVSDQIVLTKPADQKTLQTSPKEAREERSDMVEEEAQERHERVV